MGVKRNYCLIFIYHITYEFEVKTKKNLLWDSTVRCLLNGTAKTSFLKQYLIENVLTTHIWRRILFFYHKPNCNFKELDIASKIIKCNFGTKNNFGTNNNFGTKKQFWSQSPILRTSFPGIGKFTQNAFSPFCITTLWPWTSSTYLGDLGSRDGPLYD